MEKMRKKICDSSILLLFIFFAFYICTKWYDADMYHLIATGRNLLTNGFIQYNNIAIFGGKIVIQQWLYAVVIALLADNVGGIGLYSLNVLFFLLTSFLLHKIMAERGIQSSSNLILSFFLSCSFIYNNIRPEWITLDLILFEIYVVERYRNTKQRQILYLLFVIGLLEINLHAAYWIFHYIYLLPYIVPPVVFKKSIKKNSLAIKPFIGPVIAMSSALFMNPYGIDNILYVFKSYPVIGKVYIKELQSNDVNSFFGLLLIFSCLLLGYLVLKQGMGSIDFYMASGSLFLCCLNIKSFDKYPIFLLFITLILFQRDSFKRLRNLEYKVSANMLYITILFTVIYGFFSIHSIRGSLVTNINKIDRLVCSELYGKITIEQHKNIYCGLTEGAYLSYLGYDHLLLDSRPELWGIEWNEEKDYLSDYLSSSRGYDTKTNVTWTDEDYATFIAEYDFDCIILKKTRERIMDRYLMTRADYYLENETDKYKIYRKK